MTKIGIIDYGAGNLMSVSNALKYLGFESSIISETEKFDWADAIILPGVGAFPAAAKSLEASGFVPLLQDTKKPFLGICIGMQLLFDMGHEFEPYPGLGLIGGEVKKIETDLKLPHIGWNSLNIKKQSPIFKGIDNGAYVYFVHSYAGVGASEDNLVAQTDYGTTVTAAVQRDNVFGCQFHPEKSGEIGLQILRNFCELV